ncbi:MAG: DUF3817 domain-containing protein [Arcobacteraceae bacterium]|nr:DUF3817 domain-containing protein [Arcobacteraceae bacterium]MDY0327043.1 DUF3817 domain-containing protein [Arcobacteraceae bacterium]
MFGNHFTSFRKISFIEGISYMILLFIAMPLKYFADLPVFVKVVGMAHGALFVLFLVYLFLAARENNWNIKFNALAFVASLVPFGTFYLETRLKQMVPVTNEN